MSNKQIKQDRDRYLQLLAEVAELLNGIQPPLTSAQKQGVLDGTLKLKTDADGGITVE